MRTLTRLRLHCTHPFLDFTWHFRTPLFFLGILQRGMNLGEKIRDVVFSRFVVVERRG